MARTTSSCFQKPTTTLAVSNAQMVNNLLNKWQIGEAGPVDPGKTNGIPNFTLYLDSKRWSPQVLHKTSLPGAVHVSVFSAAWVGCPTTGQQDPGCQAVSFIALGEGGSSQNAPCNCPSHVQSIWPFPQHSVPFLLFTPLWLEHHSITCYSNWCCIKLGDGLWQ